MHEQRWHVSFAIGHVVSGSWKTPLSSVHPIAFNKMNNFSTVAAEARHRRMAKFGCLFNLRLQMYFPQQSESAFVLSKSSLAAHFGTGGHFSERQTKILRVKKKSY